MKRIVTGLLIVFALAVGYSTCLAAQDLSADQFLEQVSAHPVGDEVERDQFLKTGDALNLASPKEVERVLPSLLRFTRSGNAVRVRAFAIGYLLDIALRPDGADLLSSKSEEISSLIVDADPGIQKVALAVTDYVIAKPATNKPTYVLALKAAIQKAETPQGVDLEIVGPLLYTRFYDSSAVKPVLDFIHRDDLTADTRRELVHSLGTVDGLPDEINTFLYRELDDRDATVRATALVTFADSTTTFHTLSKDRVARMANDPQENPQVRELAKQAIAGKTALNPNIDMPPDH